jgi:hypothetical protein
MKNTKIFAYLLLAVAGIFMVSCEGPVGPPGRDGYDGNDGLDGLDGNANVIYSDWYVPNSWGGQTGDWFFQVASASITENIVESGVILAYVSLPGDVYGYPDPQPVRPLPTYAIGANWSFLIPDYGLIEFTCDAASVPGTTDHYFRFILIPATNPALKSALKSKSIKDIKTELKNMPYSEVCKKFGIPE